MCNKLSCQLNDAKRAYKLINFCLPNPISRDIDELLNEPLSVCELCISSFIITGLNLLRIQNTGMTVNLFVQHIIKCMTQYLQFRLYEYTSG